MYIKNGFWVCLSVFVIYYSNFFHHLFLNPNINETFFQISMAGYTMIVMLIIYTTFVLPIFYGINSIQEYNPKLIPVGVVVGVVAVISLLIAIWPVWGFLTFPIFITLWILFFICILACWKNWYFNNNLGDFLFLLRNIGTVLSFYAIEHEGYLHWNNFFDR